MPAVRKSHAFTLVELLVVLAIIGVLTALAIPGYSAIRQKSQATKCVTNLRDLGVSLSLYLADHDMTMPYLSMRREKRSQNSDVIDTVLNAYTDNPQIFCCPADTTIAAASGTSYDWNPILCGQAFAQLNFGPPDEGEKNLSKITVMYEKEDWHEKGRDALNTVSVIDGQRTNVSMVKLNTLFADGHIARYYRLIEIESPSSSE